MSTNRLVERSHLVYSVIMCGRFMVSDPNRISEELLGTDDGVQFETRYNIAPGHTIPVALRRIDASLTLTNMRWGLVPRWSKDQNLGYRLINARVETVSSKRAFRDSLHHRRCIVPADGFYEWRRRPSGKQPYLCRLTGSLPFGFAGLWDRWTEPNGTALKTFTILTTSANALIRPIHSRMPVILDRSQREEWLGVGDPLDTLARVSKPHPALAMETFPITTFVNNADNDSLQCLEPLETDRNQTIF